MRTPAAIAIFAATCASIACAEGPRFTQVSLTIRAMNADGNIAVGVGVMPGYSSASIWYNISAGTQEHIVATPARPLSTHVSGVSSDGSIFASNSGSSGFRTVLGAGSVPIERYPGASSTTVSAISGDGNVLVGVSDLYGNGINIFPFRWTPQTGRQEIGPASGMASGRVHDMSRDGNTIIGMAVTQNAAAWAWRENTGLVYLPALSTAGTEAKAVSADGSVIAGTSRLSSDPFENFVVRWVSGNIQPFPLPAGMINPGVEDISDDGSVIVGGIVIHGSSARWGMVCTPDLGLMFAHDYLAMHGLVLPAGVQIERVYAVSADATTFGGSLRDGTGFVATVPAPATAALLAAAGLVATRRRRGC